MADIPTEGTVEKPYRQNPPRMFIEVHWRSGPFVSGATRYADIDTAIRALVMGDPPHWDNLGVGAFELGEVMGAAVGAGCFVLVGAANSQSTYSYGVIMASRDGRTWESVYTGQRLGDTDTANGSMVFGVVWDGAKFWAGAHESNNGPNPATDVYEVDLLLSSEDGRRWDEAGRHNIPIAEWGDGYETGLLAAHCSDKVKDSLENGVPDGFYGTKQLADSELLIRPTSVRTIDYLFGGLSNPDGGIFASTVIVGGRTVEVGIPVAAVAYAAGKWVAVGGAFADGEAAQSAHSADDGETWARIDTDGISAAMCSVVGAA
jgi:hypothetical protein